MNRTLSAGILAATYLAAVSCQQSQPAAAAQPPAERGKYLVTIGSCNDCHTPGSSARRDPSPT